VNRNKLREAYATYSVVQWFFPAILIIGTLYLVVTLLLNNPAHHTFLDLVTLLITDSSGLTGFLLAFVVSAFITIHFYTLPRIKKVILRQDLIQSGSTGEPLAQPQPSQLTGGLPLPISASTKFNRWGVTLYFLPVMALIGVSVVNPVLWRNTIVSDIVIITGMWIVFGLPWALVDRPQFNIAPKTQVTATDQYLLVTRGNMSYTVQWREARLFSVIGAREVRPMVLRYALEGNGVTAEWWMYTRPPRWFDVARLGMPYEEYDQRMREILSVVSAKTGLPLLDLR
jgi:hypothetical protein